MASSPQIKVYDANGKYMASCKEVAGASLLMSLYGDGSTIRIGHRTIVWTQGEDADGDASQSYDGTAELIRTRVHPLIAPTIY